MIKYRTRKETRAHLSFNLNNSVLKQVLKFDFFWFFPQKVPWWKLTKILTEQISESSRAENGFISTYLQKHFAW